MNAYNNYVQHQESRQKYYNKIYIFILCPFLCKIFVFLLNMSAASLSRQPKIYTIFKRYTILTINTYCISYITNYVWFSNFWSFLKNLCGFFCVRRLTTGRLRTPKATATATGERNGHSPVSKSKIDVSLKVPVISPYT